MNKLKIMFGLLAIILAFAIHTVNVFSSTHEDTTEKTAYVLDEFEFSERMMATLSPPADTTSPHIFTDISETECRYANCREKLSAAKNAVLPIVNATCTPRNVRVRCCNANGKIVVLTDIVYPSPRCKSDKVKEYIEDF